MITITLKLDIQTENVAELPRWLAQANIVRETNDYLVLDNKDGSKTALIMNTKISDEALYNVAKDLIGGLKP